MKLQNFAKIFLAVTLLMFLHNSCGKHNPEDPLPHFRHLNNRLEGEWELEKITVNGVDSSAYLNINSMPIARFFKFEPKEDINTVEGNGVFYIKSKASDEYTEYVGACPSEGYIAGDESKAKVKLSYKFREGTKEGEDFFQINFSEVIYVFDFDSNTPVFKPFNETYKIFNNFYYRPFYILRIMKATNRKFILQRITALGIEGIDPIEYRFEFKKIN